MPKVAIAIIASLLTITGIAILSLSFGWYLMVLLVLLIPAMYIHILAKVKIIQWAPGFFPVLFISGLTFIFFSLVRPESDTFGNFSGQSALLFKLGLAEEQYIDGWSFALEASLLSLLLMVYIDVFLLTRAKKAKKKEVAQKNQSTDAF